MTGNNGHAPSNIHESLMQLTRFDHWLRKTFLHEMHIRTLRPAPDVPPRVKVIDLPETPVNRYRHLYIARKSKDADALIKALREAGQMFSPEIVERQKWYLRIICPPHKSFTWNLVSLIFVSTVTVSVVLWVIDTLRKPSVQKAIENLRELL